MSIDGDPLKIPQDDLIENLGEDSWGTVHENIVRLPTFGEIGILTFNTFKVKRVRRWVRAEHPIHYATDVITKTTRTTGYKRTERQTFEQYLELSVGTAEPLGGLNANVKASLKLTADTSQEWREEFTETVDITYAKNTTYVGWQLLDTVFAHRDVRLDWVKGNNRDVYHSDTLPGSDAVLDIVLRFYQDGIPDQEMKVFNGVVNSMRSDTQ